MKQGCIPTGVLTAALALLAGVSIPGRAEAQQPAINPGVNIDQEKLLKGEYPLRKVLESGGNFYTTPFTPADGYGEGPTGPRAAQRKAFNPSAPNYPYLRLNGLDSQSCFECHNSIGSYNEPGTQSQALLRKPGTIGGSAGSNSNAFINPVFPERLTLFIRNPPHVFGTGYTQTLANEITTELLFQRQMARQQAKAHPGVKQTVALVAHGQNFGSFSTTYLAGSPAKVVGAELNTCVLPGQTPQVPTATQCAGEAGFTDDITQVTGVNCDFVVRPFQWKGVSSSVRHFARDALDFHFSMQAYEKVGDCDCDGDGHVNELGPGNAGIGNVTALVSFVAMTRPPTQIIPKGSEARVALGRSIFTGEAKGTSHPLSGQMCATCHVPTQTVQVPQLVIDNPIGDPIPADQCPNACPSESTFSGGYGALVSPVASSSELPVVKRFNRHRAAMSRAVAAKGGRAQPFSALFAGTKLTAEDGYVIPLSLPPLTNVPPYVFPRLPTKGGGPVQVPLFSDLRTHNMGKFLQDTGATQGLDVAGLCAPAPNFLTRPLWGVADTGPWLHDGRALTLMDAILMHGDTASGSGSEAASVIDAFEALNPNEQQAVVDFLLTLRLPLPPGVTASNANPPNTVNAGFRK